MAIFFVELTIISLNPYEYPDESKVEIAEMGFALNLDIKETTKKDSLLKFPDNITLLEENGFLEFDNIILMSEEKTETKFKETDGQFLHYSGKALFHTVDGYRLSGLIHEFIHIYENKFGKPIVRDTFDTESMLQIKMFLDYLSVHSLDPKDIKLSFIGESCLKKL